MVDRHMVTPLASTDDLPACVRACVLHHYHYQRQPLALMGLGDDSGDGSGDVSAWTLALPPEAQAALRHGAFQLLGALGPGGAQHVHAALGGQAGGARRAALSELKAEYERVFKYSGKI